jgi:hypothetical protein
MRLDPGQDLFGPEGFGDIVHAAEGEGFYLIDGLVNGADKNDRNPGGLPILKYKILSLRHGGRVHPQTASPIAE